MIKPHRKQEVTSQTQPESQQLVKSAITFIAFMKNMLQNSETMSVKSRKELTHNPALAFKDQQQNKEINK